MNKIKMICGNCMDFMKDKNNKYYCDIRYLLKNGEKISKLAVSKNKRGCDVFMMKN